MIDLSFQVAGVEAQPFSAAPALNIKLLIANADVNARIQTITLRCQIQIEAARRTYSDSEQQHLRELFDEPARWSQTLRTMLWAHTSMVVPAFTGTTSAEMPLPCSFDFNIAATKYFAGLAEGTVPLVLQFSGTTFFSAADGALQVAQIPWHKEARYQLPVRVWHEMMEIYYPNSAWLCLRRDVFDRLYQYKVRHGLLTWEQALEALLEEE